MSPRGRISMHPCSPSKAHISPQFKRAVKEECKYCSVFPVSGSDFRGAALPDYTFYKFWGSFLRTNISIKICLNVLIISRIRTKQHITKPNDKEQDAEGCHGIHR